MFSLDLEKHGVTGRDSCGCPVQICVAKKKVCKPEEDPFAGYGRFIFRNERHSGVRSTSVLKSELYEPWFRLGLENLL